MALNRIKSIFKDHSELQTYAKGEKIYSPGVKVNEIFCIKDGSVKIGCYNEKGREITKFIFFKDEIFGEQAIAGLEKRRDFAFAIEKTKIQKIDIEALRRVIKTDQELSLFFLKLLGKRNIALDERLESIVFKDSKPGLLIICCGLLKKRAKKWDMKL